MITAKQRKGMSTVKRWKPLLLKRLFSIKNREELHYRDFIPDRWRKQYLLSRRDIVGLRKFVRRIIHRFVSQARESHRLWSRIHFSKAISYPSWMTNPWHQLLNGLSPSKANAFNQRIIRWRFVKAQALIT